MQTRDIISIGVLLLVVVGGILLADFLKKRGVVPA